MRKTLIFTTFLLCFTNLICLSQKNITEFELGQNNKLNIHLYGKVNTIKIKTENLKDNSSDSAVYRFNTKGFPEKIISYDLGFNPMSRKLVNEEVHYDYRENKLLSKLNKLSFGNDGEIYEYDENWNLISLKNYMSNVLVKETLSKYDDQNKIVEKTEYLFGGFSNYNPITELGKSKYLEEIEKYEYNAQNKITLKLTYKFRENKTVKITKYKYDNNDNIIEEGTCLSYGEPNCEIKPLFGYEYNSKGLIVKKYQLAKFSPHNTDEYYIYDEQGNKIEIKGLYIYTDKEPILGFDYKSEFDKFGNKTKEVENTGNYRMIGFEKYKTQITNYDKFQNIITDEYLNSVGQTIKLTKKNYDYDKKGNWIKMEEFEGKNKENLKLIEICKREIKYF